MNKHVAIIVEHFRFYSSSIPDDVEESEWACVQHWAAHTHTHSVST